MFKSLYAYIASHSPVLAVVSRGDVKKEAMPNACSVRSQRAWGTRWDRYIDAVRYAMFDLHQCTRQRSVARLGYLIW